MRHLRPEVLAPAGSPEALQAAVAAGADAVYFGLTDYNARIRARNFDLGDLPSILADLRRWGVRSYLTFNTLLFLEEIPAARAALEAIALAGPDGVIVQDPGVVQLIRQVAPGLPIHASTQMTVASADAVRFVERLGISRVILARELSVTEIARIRSAVTTELEVFVHGALCVSYSGQCLSSEAWGGRSANRGQCAQACRLPYDLMVDGLRRDLGDRVYLLSPRDLEGYARIPELTRIGISAFKIEGRMKSAEYVGAATALYRRAVDDAWRKPEEDEKGGQSPGVAIPPPRGRSRDLLPAGKDLDRLAREARQVFSRGASEGFLGGVDHQVLVDGRTRSHRGLPVGFVVRLERHRSGKPDGVVMELSKEAGDGIELRSGDGLLLAVTAREEDEIGGRISEVETLRTPGQVRVRFPRASRPDLDRVQPGTPVYRTADPHLLGILRRRHTRPDRTRAVPLRAVVHGVSGEPLRLSFFDPEGREVRVASTTPLSPAARAPLGSSTIEEHLSRLGGTRYRLDDLTVELEAGLFLPVSELNRIRRDAVAALETMRGASGAQSRTTRVHRDGPPGQEPGGRDPSPVAWAVERAEETAAVQGGSEPPTAGAAGAVHPGEHPDRAPDRSPEGRGSIAPAGSRDPEGASIPLSFEQACLVLCRNETQVRGALDAGARRIVLDFLDLVGLREVTAQVHAEGARVTLALPRVQKPGEERIEGFFLRLDPAEILVRNLGGLERLRALVSGSGLRPAPELVGDISLNAVNADSIGLLLDADLARIAPGLDLNGEQLEHLVEQVDGARIEIPLHHHLPVFHTEHCVFAAFLSDGADFRTCGRPCDRHQIELRDRTGQRHPVVADVGCRNTVFGARPQSVIAHLDALRRSGVRHFRLELISQDRDQTVRLVDLYRGVWDGRRGWREVLSELHADSRYGVSTGSPDPPRSLPLKPVGGRRPTAADRGSERGRVRPGRGRRRS